MEKPRGNLDDVVPPQQFGTRLSHAFLIEMGLWFVAGLLWLAFEGGVVGLMIVAVVAVITGFAWRDISRRAKNPIQSQSNR
jgi:tetrahydromethanopterin S-methyltransferase subunit B